MKKCAECSRYCPIHSGFCAYCGTRMDTPADARRERWLFALTPIFLILLGAALGVELGIGVNTGLIVGGIFCALFLLGGVLFYLMVLATSMPALSRSYWQSGIFALSHFMAAVFISYSIEVLVFSDVIRNLGPYAYSLARLEILAMYFLPTFFMGILSVSARARAIRFPDKTQGWAANFFFKNTVIVLPLITLLLGVIFTFAQNAPTQSLIQARILRDVGASAASMQLIDETLTEHSDYAPLYYLKGLVILDARLPELSLETAIESFERAVELEPEVPLFLFRLSLAYEMAGHAEPAVAAARKAAELLEDDAFFWEHLGNTHLKFGQREAAVESYKKALKHAPDNPVLMNNLAFTCLEIDQDLPLALQLARRSVERLPGMVFNVDTLAWAYFKNGMYTQALETIMPIVKGQQEISAEIEFHYAMILKSLDGLKSPIKAFDRLLIRPDVIEDRHLFDQILNARQGLDEQEFNQDSEQESEDK